MFKKLRTKESKKFVFPKKIKECGGDGSIKRNVGESVHMCVEQDSFVQNNFLNTETGFWNYISRFLYYDSICYSNI